MAELSYKRVLLKVSGEALMGAQSYGIENRTVERIASEIAGAAAMDVEICVVIGGGNIFRGVAGVAQGMDRTTADSMGMLATVMNALAIEQALEDQGVAARTMSAIPMPTICEPYARQRATRHLSKGRVVVFAAGTGNPFFTTDTAAALRAAEMHATALLKGTNVDGVYSADPKKDPEAERFDSLTHLDVLSRDLNVMDAAAITLARDNRIPIIVFSIQTEGALGAVLRGEGRFTIVADPA